MKKMFIAISIFLTACICQKVQQQGAEGPYRFTAEVISIDTVMLVSEDYLANSVLPAELFKAKIITLNIADGSKDHPDINSILIEWTLTDHGCSFDFLVKKDYLIHAYLEEYRSESILPKYRRKFLKIDCKNLPRLSSSATSSNR